MTSKPQKIHRWDVKSYEEDGVLKDWVEEADHIAVIDLYNGLLEQLETYEAALKKIRMYAKQPTASGFLAARCADDALSASIPASRQEDA